MSLYIYICILHKKKNKTFFSYTSIKQNTSHVNVKHILNENLYYYICIHI